MHHPRIAHTTAFVTLVAEHSLEREIAQWVYPMKNRSDDPSHHERTLLPRSYISLPSPGRRSLVAVSVLSYFHTHDFGLPTPLIVIFNIIGVFCLFVCIICCFVCVLLFLGFFLKFVFVCFLKGSVWFFMFVMCLFVFVYIFRVFLFLSLFRFVRYSSNQVLN